VRKRPEIWDREIWVEISDGKFCCDGYQNDGLLPFVFKATLVVTLFFKISVCCWLRLLNTLLNLLKLFKLLKLLKSIKLYQKQNKVEKIEVEI
jgi:hypothetical protein